MSEMLSDDVFKKYAQQQEQEAKLAKTKMSSSNNWNKDFEQIKYCGLETGKAKIIRVIDGPPDSNISDYTCRTVNICEIYDDEGKKTKMIRPSFNDDPNFILNKIIKAVRQTKWVNNTKVFPVKDEHPDIWNLIDKCGIESTDSRYIYTRGWTGKEVLLMNVIDRSDMEWHRQNKHTMLLARSVNTTPSGAVFADEGVSAYALSQPIAHLFKAYGSWEKYDIAITRTGQKMGSYLMVNASNSPMEVDEDVRPFISTSTELTDEEKSWTKYNLAQIFRVSTNTKIYNRLKNTIKRIDGALGTSFLEELQEKVAEEKKLWSEMYPEEAKVETPVMQVETPAPVVEEAPVVTPTRTAQVAETVTTNDLWADLPYGSTLSDVLKAKVTSVEKDDSGKVVDIKWNMPFDQLYSCPTCGAVSPLDATECPACGMKF